MSSNPPPAIVSSKSVNSSGQLSPAQTQAGPAAASDSHGQRRNGGSGSFGAGAASRASPAPRNNQASRKQNKGSKRFRLADEDAMAESAAMRSTSSRKGQTSITHLMNFSLPPRPQSYYQHLGHNRSNRRNPTWGVGSGYHAVDKARYIHANYRFVVDPRFNYNVQSVDTDVHLDWSNVLQILASAQTQSASCPICLGDPVSPRMAKCGHIFCLPCLIRFMHAEGETSHTQEKRPRWKKCPLCFDSIYMSDTKPARMYTGQEGEPPREGADVVLRLFKRQADSTLALPRDCADVLVKGEDIPWYNAAEVMDYARIMKGSEDYMNEQLDRDIEQMQIQEKEDELMFESYHDPEWTRKAIRMINETKEKVKGIGNPPASPNKPVDSKLKKPIIEFNESDHDVPDMYKLQHAASSGQTSSEYFVTPRTEVAITDAADARSVSATSHSSTRKLSTTSSDSRRPASSALSTSLSQLRHRQQHGHQSPSEYYFYQALLHYYLAPLDIRILREAFGSFSSFPSTVLVRVDHVSTGHVIDEDLRKRWKYLAHLPYGCEVGFLECDWADIVSPEVLEKFKPEIERRRKKNEEKEARDEKARVKAEKEEDNRAYGSARRKRLSMSSVDRFSADDFAPLVNSEAVDGAASIDAESVSTSPPWPVRRQGSAFASLASPSTSPSAPRTVWGTAAIGPTSPMLQAVVQAHDALDDGWLQGWEKDLLQDDDLLLAQAQALSLGESSRAGAASGGGRKKKARKITLMSTNARRGA